MVTYNPVDVVNITAFPYAWRIADARWTRLPDQILHRLRFLSNDRSAFICQKGERFRAPNALVNHVEYHGQTEVSLTDEGNEDARRIRGWFSQLPIAKGEEIYVSWSNGAALITDWGTFCQIWDDLWYPFDIMEVFDDTLNWAVLLGPEEYAVYIERGTIQPDALNIELARGLRLVQTLKSSDTM